MQKSPGAPLRTPHPAPAICSQPWPPYPVSRRLHILPQPLPTGHPTPISPAASAPWGLHSSLQTHPGGYSKLLAPPLSPPLPAAAPSLTHMCPPAHTASVRLPDTCTPSTHKHTYMGPHTGPHFLLPLFLPVRTKERPPHLHPSTLSSGPPSRLKGLSQGLPSGAPPPSSIAIPHTF